VRDRGRKARPQARGRAQQARAVNGGHSGYRGVSVAQSGHRIRSLTK
jgi:hypothetical protein